jgi:hypothetical protein
LERGEIHISLPKSRRSFFLRHSSMSRRICSAREIGAGGDLLKLLFNVERLRRRVEGRKIVIRKAFLIDDIEQQQPPACPTTGGRGECFAVCCGQLLLLSGQKCCRSQTIFASGDAVGSAAPQATATPQGCGPAFLASGVSLVRRLASLCAHCETPYRSALAPPWVAGILAPAFMLQREGGPPPDSAGNTKPDPAHGHREPTLGSAKDSGGAGEAWVQSLRQNGSVGSTPCRRGAVGRATLCRRAPCRLASASPRGFDSIGDHSELIVLGQTLGASLYPPLSLGKRKQNSA